MFIKVIDESEVEFPELDTSRTDITVNTVTSKLKTYDPEDIRDVTPEPIRPFKLLDPAKVENTRVFTSLLFELFKKNCLTFAVNTGKLDPESEVHRYLSDQ